MTFKLTAWHILAITTALVSFAPPNYAQTSEAAEKKALFGELHMHTSWSFDAFIFKVRSSPDDAYRFAKGQPLKHPSGKSYQLSRPLDFMAVTDHAEYMGALPNMINPSHPYSRLEITGKVMSPDVKIATSAFQEIAASLLSGNAIADLTDKEIQTSTWQKMVDAANQHNDPGTFTALIGYEWTSVPDGENLHRNVIFEGDNAPLPFSSLQSTRPEDLWQWMDQVRDQGHRLLAIPHNSNISNGRMFERLDSSGNKLTVDYAQTRMRNEPIVEITQVKGTSETHPGLSPNDEFADFELVEQLVAQSVPITKFRGGYVRDAYLTGLEMQDKDGLNPYRFGLIGSTDSHTGIAPIDEDNYSGKVGVADGTPQARLLQPPTTMDLRRFSASGLAAVWATENTREGIFQALERKESWATTGPRIRLRFFAGWNMGELGLNENGWVKKAYQLGVPMGGVLNSNDADGAPSFAVWAMKDADGVNLDRIQIIKGWSESGTSHEKIFDVALSDGRTADPKTGVIPAVGNSIDPKTLETMNTIGDVQLGVVWTDPEFDAGQNAFYYARVIEIPTPRWSVFDARELGIPHPEDLPKTIQERAFSSPIWYDVK